MTTDLNPALVMERLQEIERDLAELQNAWETVSVEHARLDREIKRFLAVYYLEAGGTQKERDAKALAKASKLPAYERFAEAEDGLVRCKALFQVLDKRASVGQSILRAMTRENFELPQPSWR